MDDLKVGTVYLCEVWVRPRILDGKCQGNTSRLELLKYDGIIETERSITTYYCGEDAYEMVSGGPTKIFVPVPGSDLPPGPVCEINPLRVMQPDAPQPEKQEVNA